MGAALETPPFVQKFQIFCVEFQTHENTSHASSRLRDKNIILGFSSDSFKDQLEVMTTNPNSSLPRRYELESFNKGNDVSCNKLSLKIEKGNVQGTKYLSWYLKPSKIAYANFLGSNIEPYSFKLTPELKIKNKLREIPRNKIKTSKEQLAVPVPAFNKISSKKMRLLFDLRKFNKMAPEKDKISTKVDIRINIGVLLKALLTKSICKCIDINNCYNEANVKGFILETEGKNWKPLRWICQNKRDSKLYLRDSNRHLLFGLSFYPIILEHITDDVLLEQGLSENVIFYLDDGLLVGKTPQEIELNQEKLEKGLKAFNLRLDKEKEIWIDDSVRDFSWLGLHFEKPTSFPKIKCRPWLSILEEAWQATDTELSFQALCDLLYRDYISTFWTVQKSFYYIAMGFLARLVNKYHHSNWQSLVQNPKQILRLFYYLNLKIPIKNDIILPLNPQGFIPVFFCDASRSGLLLH